MSFETALPKNSYAVLAINDLLNKSALTKNEVRRIKSCIHDIAENAYAVGRVDHQKEIRDLLGIREVEQDTCP